MLGYQIDRKSRLRTSYRRVTLNYMLISLSLLLSRSRSAFIGEQVTTHRNNNPPEHRQHRPTLFPSTPLL